MYASERLRCVHPTADALALSTVTDLEEAGIPSFAASAIAAFFGNAPKGNSEPASAPQTALAPDPGPLPDLEPQPEASLAQGDTVILYSR